MKKETHVNEQHKDRLFNFIFGRPENREWTLSLYNAVNGSNYTDASLIEYNTLENVLYIAMKNDTSFIISGTLNVYEHQSTYNPNMPLRLMEYVVELFSGYIKSNKHNKYGTSLIKLPTPKLVVFYNGIDRETEDECILKLSDSFDASLGTDADIEVRVRMLNVNDGRNKKLMEACKPLEEYAWFVGKIREIKNEILSVEETVERAISAMPHEFVIRDFILKHRAEVCGMLDTEYNEEEIRELFMEDGRREERANTEREKARADAEKQRADSLQAKLDAILAKNEE